MRINPQLELLCLLPKAPLTALLRDLADDLNWDCTQNYVLGLAAGLKVSYGIATELHQDDNCRALCVSASSWDAAQAIGNEYWKSQRGKSDQ